ncbi:hypothetical protein VZO05_06820 [Aggregatilineales bacterium SYSU G02658]
MTLFPEDRVLVGVVKRRRDLRWLLDQRRYRVPVAALPDGVNAEVLGFFLRGAVYYYAALRGVELVRRRDLLPNEPQHPRAEALYWLCQLGPVRETRPPIVNASRRAFAFVHTTWDRFADALTLDDLYRDSPYYVRRVYAPRNASMPYTTAGISLE